MREDAFRAFLARSFDARSVGSYVANLRRVERDLGLDLDAVDLDEPGIDHLHARLVASNMPRNSADNCRSAIRCYARFASPPIPDARQATPATIRSSWMTAASVADLVQTYGDILDELRDRGILRTANAPVGDYAEHLLARALGWTLSANSTSGYDAMDAAGCRYQIKARRLTTKATSRQLGAIRRLDSAPFDRLAAVLFNADMTVQRAVILPVATVKPLCTYVAHTNSWRLMLSDAVMAMPDVIDVTGKVRATAKT